MPSSPSFFKRVTRYAINPRADPRENRLTEITATVLEQVPEFALAFAKQLAKEAAAEREARCGPDARVTHRTLSKTLEGFAPADLEVVRHLVEL